MDPKTLFEKCLKQATAIVSLVERRQFSNATPCTEWDMRALLNHLLYELSWVADIVGGKTISEVGTRYDGNLLGDDHVKSWDKAAGKAMDAVKKADMKSAAHLSYGDRPMEHYVREVATDLLIHGWDVAQGMKCSLKLDPEATEEIYKKALPHADDFEKSGVYGKRIKVAKDADTQTKLLAILGRTAPII